MAKVIISHNNYYAICNGEVHIHILTCTCTCMCYSIHVHVHVYIYIHVQQLVVAYQIEVLACLAEEEALHPILMRLLHNVVQRSIATPGKVYMHSTCNVHVISNTVLCTCTCHCVLITCTLQKCKNISYFCASGRFFHI